MTVKELLKELQYLQEKGYGNEKVVIGDYLHLELGYESINSVNVRDFADSSEDYNKYVYIY